jgi:hypothetical protein
MVLKSRVASCLSIVELTIADLEARGGDQPTFGAAPQGPPQAASPLLRHLLPGAGGSVSRRESI